jgi:hypothetical protein
VGTRIAGRVIYSKTEAVWKRKDDLFFLYIRGDLQTSNEAEAVPGTSGSDLEVRPLDSGTIYILPGYAIRADNKLRPAEKKE